MNRISQSVKRFLAMRTGLLSKDSHAAQAGPHTDLGAKLLSQKDYLRSEERRVGKECRL